MAQLNFDASQVQPDAGFSVIEPGWYNVAIDESDMKPTKTPGGAYLHARFNILDGQHAGKKLFHRFNLRNDNPTAQEIGFKQLSAVCHAVGLLQVGDSAQLHGMPMKVKVKIRKDKSGEYEDQNEITTFKNINEQVVQPSSPAAGFGGAPQGGFGAPAGGFGGAPGFGAPQNGPQAGFGAPVQFAQPQQTQQAPAFAQPQQQFQQPAFAAAPQQQFAQPQQQPAQAQQQFAAPQPQAQQQMQPAPAAIAPQQQMQPQQQVQPQGGWQQPTAAQPWANAPTQPTPGEQQQFAQPAMQPQAQPQFAQPQMINDPAQAAAQAIVNAGQTATPPWGGPQA